MWTNRYVGIAFKHDGRSIDGCDCWGLVRIVYHQELGIELPEYAGTLTDNSIGALRRAVKAVDKESAKWIRVQEPKAFDVTVLRLRSLNCHVGVVIDHKHMLHIEEGINASIESYQSLMWRNRIACYFRHRQLA